MCKLKPPHPNAPPNFTMKLGALEFKTTWLPLPLTELLPPRLPTPTCFGPLLHPVVLVVLLSR